MMQTEISNPQSLAGLRILIAEDDELNRQLLEIVLTGAGAEVTQVCNGEAATAVFHPDRFDLAILDLRMPRQDGIKTLATLRLLDPQFPVAALTACARREDKLACQAAGFQLFLTKPILPGELVSAIAKLAEARVAQTIV